MAKALLTTQRKRKPKILAVINENCTSCAGSPVCVEYCPVADCMLLIQDPDNPLLQVIWVEPLLCIGCKKCTSKGPEGTFLDGCPWDAIDMEELAVSREIFRDHGNMSSPTILFILDRLRDNGAALPCVALAFGPGLVAEAILFA